MVTPLYHSGSISFNSLVSFLQEDSKAKTVPKLVKAEEALMLMDLQAGKVFLEEELTKSGTFVDKDCYTCLWSNIEV